MMKFTLISIFLTCLVCSTAGYTFWTVDTFLDPPRELFFEVSPYEEDIYAWWTPYYISPGAQSLSYGPPQKLIINTLNALGGQRDLVLGHEDSTPVGSGASVEFGLGVGGVSFTLGYVGGGYLQYDGYDNPATNAGLNVLPGIGAATNISYPLYSGGPNAQGSLDFTAGGRAVGIAFNATVDLDVLYTFDLFDRLNNSAKQEITVRASQGYIRYFMPYSVICQGVTGNCWDLDTGFEGFGRINALQIAIYTFDEGTASIDTNFRLIDIYGNRIFGTVFQDCDCNRNNGVDGNVTGQVITLRTGTGVTPSGTVLNTTTTNAAGFYEFFYVVQAGSYQVCLETPNAGFNLCAGQAVCQVVTLDSTFERTISNDFVLAATSSFTPPPAVTINCGECNTTQCLGCAQSISCASGQSQVCNANDVRSANGCGYTITRTFTASGQSVTQIITVVDNQAPVVTTPAADVISQCTGNGVQTYQQFLSNNAGARFADCSAFSVTNNAPATTTPCTAVTVIFTARDACNLATSVTATYSVSDNQAPTFTTQASPGQADCNTNGSDFTALNQYLANNGGARATDNCGTPTITNNYVTGSLVRGCNSQVTIIFTASDSCNNIATTSSTFTIVDTTAPVITTPASDQTVQCGPNTNDQFNAFRANRGGLVVSDACQSAASLTYTDNFTGAVPSGCNGVATVTFSVTDGCGGPAAVSTATFRVTDTTRPVFTTQPSPLNINCNDANAQQTLNNYLNNNGGAVATDNCGAVTFSNNFSSLNGSCTNAPVTFTVCDSCTPANCATATTTISITDNAAPTYTTPPTDQSVQCGPNSAAAFNAWIQSNAGAQLTDNCTPSSQITLTNNYNGQAPANGCLSVTTVQFFARDTCNNVAPTRTATFTITDTTAPVITNPASSTQVECGTNVQADYASFRNNRGGATASDDCIATNNIVWTNDGPATVGITTGCTAVYTVTFTANDGCGNVARTTAEFTIRDTVAPVITTPASNANGPCTQTNNNATVQAWLNNNGGARASDACSAVTFTNNFNGFSGGCTSTAQVTFVARDVCGLATPTTATFTVSDDQGPIITTPAAPASAPCDANTGAAITAYLNNRGGAQATDACSGSTGLQWTNNYSGALNGCNFEAITFTVTDPCGFSTTTTGTFTVTDTTAPTFTPGASDTIVQCQANGNTADYQTFISTRGGAVATDSCSFGITYTNDAPVTGPTRCGSQRVTFTATDNCNNVARTTATFTVRDNEAPIFTTLPSDRLVDCDGAGNTAELQAWLAANGNSLAVDTCAPAAELVYSNSRVGQTGNNCQSAQVYNFVVRDTCGNTVNATAAFLIRDFTNPQISTPASNLVVECDGQGNQAAIRAWLASNAGLVATDACQGRVNITNDFTGTGPTGCQSELVNFIIDDTCGNRIQTNVLIDIRDTQDPIFANVPQDVTLPCDSDVSVAVLGQPIATDICAGDTLVSFSDVESDEPAVGNCPGDHIILRTFTSSDNCGNIATVQQIIRINIARSSGPCDPSGCECDNCCPPAAASDCLPQDCAASNCSPVPCSASVCTCVSSNKDAQVFRDQEDIAQCEPVYIYVHDDDDTVREQKDGAVAQQRMLITNRLLETETEKPTVVGSAATLAFSFVLAIVALVFLA